MVLNADGQNDPAEIPGMVKRVLEEHERDGRVVGVIGHRVTRRDEWVKRISSKIANGFRNVLPVSQVLSVQ